ncbi:hypothetical protein [Companilactobacillus alimentarius]|uniref:Uncharacterized protein n=1 Tax=Companilactobacillus alimentarius DSM 20249 TaxID=1423720 RepID=A0A2K9HGZ7_9LACO|nr:hypothetical protein [Companilactobacillus alimentarius]AUI71789.1 hypothetical protein LA20249_06190 [Companilactobacillus alimentarius DSM 20249]KRK75820.1 hypothetical protein FC67_GL000815 [Companilactobacillus alimentarius DSM 20249]GEO45925.1 hypothetical protein LAL01_21570 [Companilactobacillus alimentarius]
MKLNSKLVYWLKNNKIPIILLSYSTPSILILIIEFIGGFEGISILQFFNSILLGVIIGLAFGINVSIAYLSNDNLSKNASVICFRVIYLFLLDIFTIYLANNKSNISSTINSSLSNYYVFLTFLTILTVITLFYFFKILQVFYRSIMKRRKALFDGFEKSTEIRGDIIGFDGIIIVALIGFFGVLITVISQ